jgi:propanol-preferring alcohol dehydrogenase
LTLAANMDIRTSVTEYPLPDANRALEDLREGRIEGAAVLLT